MDIKKRVQELCKQKNTTAQQLENTLGFGKGYISKLNTSVPNVSKVQQIADHFDVPLAFLLGRPPFDCWDLINQNRKGFMYYVDIDPDILQIIWGIDPENLDAAPMKDFISFLSIAVKSVRPTSEGDWEITLQPNFEKEKAPTPEGERKPKLRSVARLESADITPEMDKNIADYIDFLLKKREEKRREEQE